MLSWCIFLTRSYVQSRFIYNVVIVWLLRPEFIKMPASFPDHIKKSLHEDNCVQIICIFFGIPIVCVGGPTERRRYMAAAVVSKSLQTTL